MYTSTVHISLTLKLKTVLQIRNWNTPWYLTHRSHIKKVVFYMRDSTASQYQSVTT